MASATDLVDGFLDAVLDFDLDGFVDAVFDADEPLRWRQRGEAFEILEACTPQTSREVLAWAAGVIQHGHVMSFAGEVTAQTLGVEYSGGSLDGPRWYLGKRKGFAVAGDPSCDEDVHATVTWQHVADLFGPDTIPPALLAEIDAAMAERRRRTIEWIPGAAHSGTREQHDAWAEIELHCYDLGARVWEHARPAALRGAR